MARLYFFILLATASLASETHAQFSVRFGYRGRNLSVFGAFGRPYGYGAYAPYCGFYPATPFGVVQNRVRVEVITPTPVVVSTPRLPLPPEEVVDVSGVDLDVVNIDGEPIAQRPDFQKPRKAKPKPPPDVQPDKRPNMPLDDPAKEAQRLTKLGKQSFQQQAYGLAAFYFRRAIDSLPKARRYFLLSQARFATGKFAKSVAAIKEGLLRDPTWPRAKFDPRDLYQANKADFDLHLQRLENAVKRRPKNADYLFLLAYQLWFDGRRGDAVRYFRRARNLMPNKMLVDLFLK